MIISLSEAEEPPLLEQAIFVTLLSPSALCHGADAVPGGKHDSQSTLAVLADLTLEDQFLDRFSNVILIACWRTSSLEKPKTATTPRSKMSSRLKIPT